MLRTHWSENCKKTYAINVLKRYVKFVKSIDKLNYTRLINLYQDLRPFKTGS